MRRIRVIPVLLLHKGGLYKSIKFKNFSYVGDPINAVKIFNEKEIDEIVILDVDASSANREPDFSRIKELASEAFIPLAYGGGISTIKQIEKLFFLGVEKIILNTQAFSNPDLISDAAKLVGSQSVVASIDVRKNWLQGYKVYINNGTKNTGLDPVEYARQLADKGAGELFINAIDRDGTFSGMDYELIKKISSSVGVPVIACGGANGLVDFKNAILSGASAVAAGSLFVYQMPHRAVLISYPDQNDLIENIFTKINTTE